MKSRLFALFLALVPIAGNAESAGFPLTGTFSDMRCVEQEGDVVGLEVSLMAGFEGVKYDYFALVQFAEGTAFKPQLVPVFVDGEKISFTVRYLGGFDVKFSGKVDERGLSGRFGAPLNSEVVLPRGHGFWQSPGDLCYR